MGRFTADIVLSPGWPQGIRGRSWVVGRWPGASAGWWPLPVRLCGAFSAMVLPVYGRLESDIDYDEEQQLRAQEEGRESAQDGERTPTRVADEVEGEDGAPEALFSPSTSASGNGGDGSGDDGSPGGGSHATPTAATEASQTEAEEPEPPPQPPDLLAYTDSRKAQLRTQAEAILAAGKLKGCRTYKTYWALYDTWHVAEPAADASLTPEPAAEPAADASS